MPPRGETMKMFSASKRIGLVALAAAAVLALVPGVANASSTHRFHAVFHDIASQHNCTPPIVFCGSGTVAGYGRATTAVHATKNVPIPGTGCSDVAGTRQITLNDGSGTLVSSFTGTRC